MNKKITISNKALPIYKSTTINKNKDNTYEVIHTFIDENNSEIVIKYPKVEIKLDTTIDALKPFSCLFPYKDYQILPFGEKEELFTLMIKE